MVTILVAMATPTPHPSRTVPASGVSSTITILVAVVALLVGAAAGAIAAIAWLRRTSPPGVRSAARQAPVRSAASLPSAQFSAPQPPVQAPGLLRADTTALASAETERARLVAACADLADRLRDHQPGLFTVLSRDLQAIGVTMQLPDGEFFNADRHNPVGIEKTSNPSEDLRVAATTRLGYLDHGVTVRVPDVIIYRCDGVDHVT